MSRGGVLAGLAIALAAVIVVAAATGAVATWPPWSLSPRQEAILWSIRMPRVVLAGLVGAALGMSGAALQGIARNPLADPGLIGVSGGASLGAVGYLVLGAPAAAAMPALAPWLLPAAAFLGALAATVAAFAIARVDGRTSPVAMILGGVALSALTGAATGFLVYLADDAQLRSITFWSLGSMGAASWTVAAVVALPVAAALVGLPRLAGDLDRLLLGEAEARHLGVDVEAVVRRVAVLTALAVGAGVAVCGMIGFVGLVVPHLARGWLGPSHRTLLPAAALGGATLLIAADLAARTVVTPAELPIGILTALAGAPVLIALVRQGRGREAAP